MLLRHSKGFIAGMAVTCVFYYVLVVGLSLHADRDGPASGTAFFTPTRGGTSSPSPPHPSSAAAALGGAEVPAVSTGAEGASAKILELSKSIRRQLDQLEALAAAAGLDDGSKDNRVAVVSLPAPPSLPNGAAPAPSLPRPPPAPKPAPAPAPAPTPPQPADGERPTIKLLPRCSWSHESHYTFKPAHPMRHTEIWKRINSKDIMYTLEAGSLLGAYRHGGCIPSDGDSDMVFPVWRNARFSLPECETTLREQVAKGERGGQAVKELRALESGVVTEANAFTSNIMFDTFHVKVPSAKKNEDTEPLLCGRGRDWWVRKAHAWLKREYPSVSGRITTYGGVRWGGSTDLIVSIEDERFQLDHPCRCDWYDMEVSCWEDAGRWSERKYGPNYMRPNRKMEPREKKG